MPELAVDLDRSSPVPLYFQAAQLIEFAITNGTLGSGDRLDDEITLATRFGLSRPTMRRAIAALVDKGMLVRKRGVGTQVVQGRVTRPVELEDLIGIGDTDLSVGGLYQRMRAQAVNIRVAKQRIGARQATTEESTLLSEPKGQPVLIMERAAYDDTGRTVEWGSHAYRASRYNYEVTLVSR